LNKKIKLDFEFLTNMLSLLLDFVLSDKGRIKTKFPLQIKIYWTFDKIFRKIFRVLAVFVAEREKFKKSEVKSYSITIWKLTIQEKLIINLSKWEITNKKQEIGGYVNSSETLSEVLTCQIEAFHQNSQAGFQAFSLKENGFSYTFFSNQGTSSETAVGFWKKPIFLIVRPKKVKKGTKQKKQSRNKNPLDTNLKGADLIDLKYKIKSCIKCPDSVVKTRPLV